VFGWDKRNAIALLSLLVVIYFLLRVSVAEAALPEKALAEVNEFTQNIGALIGALGLYLGLRPTK